ncbi:hypothetical protein [Herpetosiphon gulosus]|uniref:Tetratricopeptide repeat protein n=1 Tax=Herpetosiphon gulosus TaxID=1973496 RepID=A0ABP9X9N3_9CHLR
MRKIVSIINTLCLIFILGACGNANQPIQRVTVTPINQSTNLATPPTHSANQDSVISDQLDVARSALIRNDFEHAVLILDTLRHDNPKNTEVDELLVNTYISWGDAILSKPDTTMTEVRQAYNRYQDAFEILDPNSDLYQKVKTKVTITGGYLGIIDRLNESESIEDLSERDRLIQSLLSEIDNIAQNMPELPNLNTNQAAILLAAGNIQIDFAKNQPSREAKKPYWEKANGYCSQAKSLEPNDSQLKNDINKCLDSANPPLPTRVPPTSIPTPLTPPKLRFMKLNEDDDPTCVSIQIVGINTAGWYFTIDGTNINPGYFSGQNARTCGLGYKQEYTFTVRNSQGASVIGGQGVTTIGGAIMFAEWK